MNTLQTLWSTIATRVAEIVLLPDFGVPKDGSRSTFTLVNGLCICDADFVEARWSHSV